MIAPSSHRARFGQIVVGGGAMGLATAWQLASRGSSVLLLERYSPGHLRGASHGATRNLNNAYDETHYLDLFDEAKHLYEALERASGATLLTLCGLVTHGAEENVHGAYAQLTERGSRAELVTNADARERWPGIAFEGDEVLFAAEAGRVHASTTLETLVASARVSGGDLRFGWNVAGISESNDAVTVTAVDPDGNSHRFTADGAVVTGGAWSEQLLAEHVALPTLRVTEVHPAHFAFRDTHARLEAGWPSFNHFRGGSATDPREGAAYSMLTPGEGVKVGLHVTGEAIDPDRRTFRGSDAWRQRLADYVAEFVPALDPATGVELSCTYTSTPTGDFVLDRVGRITFGAGFSGHGFKFVPAIGRVLADAATDVSLPPAPFRLAAHAAI